MYLVSYNSNVNSTIKTVELASIMICPAYVFFTLVISLTPLYFRNGIQTDNFYCIVHHHNGCSAAISSLYNETAGVAVRSTPIFQSRVWPITEMKIWPAWVSFQYSQIILPVDEEIYGSAGLLCVTDFTLFGENNKDWSNRLHCADIILFLPLITEQTSRVQTCFFFFQQKYQLPFLLPSTTFEQHARPYSFWLYSDFKQTDHSRHECHGLEM